MKSKWLQWRPHKHKITYWIMAFFYLCLAVLFLALGITGGENLPVYLVLVILWLVCSAREIYYYKKDCCS